MIGGFHFNDRRYADDDLTLGSIDPYQIFRIFYEIKMFEWESETTADIAYMVDQSHNLKGKIEAMIQTVCTAQELYARAVLVDHTRLVKLQKECLLVDAEEVLRGAFWEEVRPAVRQWRKSRGWPEDPLEAFRASGYLERITRERSEKNRGATASYA
jgi:L-rhamnose isomerase/sugar isomerase